MLHRTAWWPIVLLLSLFICGLFAASCLAAEPHSPATPAAPDETAARRVDTGPAAACQPVQPVIRELKFQSVAASSPAFAADDVLSSLTLSSSIGYFTLDWDPLADPAATPRFLGGEHLTGTLILRQPLSRLQIALAGETLTITGHPGRLRYDFNWYLPRGEDTLSWQSDRLQPAWPLTLTGTVYFGGETRIWQPGAVELTGQIEDCLTISPWLAGSA